MNAPSRLLLKLSGTAFKNENGPFSETKLHRFSQEIALLTQTELAIVVGGGNIIRGSRSELINRIEADTIGMLATVLNGLILRAYLEQAGRKAILQSAIATEFTKPISWRRARSALSNGEVVIFVGGTGNPFVTTDTAAAIRGAMIAADLIAKGSDVDGVYTDDPASGKEVHLLRNITYDKFIRERYRVMDITAVEICKEHDLPIVVFNLNAPTALEMIAAGKPVGTIIQ